MTSVITVLFGAIHCFAWSFDFPSETERLLWRIASLVTTASPAIWVVFFLVLIAKGDSSFGLGVIISFLSVIAIPIYLVGRIIILVLAVISLRSLPSSAYESVYWTTFIPHV